MNASRKILTACLRLLITVFLDIVVGSSNDREPRQMMGGMGMPMMGMGMNAMPMQPPAMSPQNPAPQPAAASGGSSTDNFVPLTMVSSLTADNTFLKLLKSPASSSSELTAAELRDATQLVFNLTDHLTAICHLQFHPPFKISSGNVGIRPQVQNDFPIPNGFIHIEPPDRRPERTILEIIRGTRQLSLLYQAVQIVPGLTDYLACNSPITFFAPNDEAVETFGISRFKLLLHWPNAMQEILTNMIVVNGSYWSTDWTSDEGLKTLNTYGSLIIKIADDGILRVINSKISPVLPSERNRPPGLLPGRAREDQALVLETDLKASNGVVHIVDNVLNPPVPSLNDTVAQIFPLHPYMPLPKIRVSAECKQILADLFDAE
ncbi:uncharacterized protein LOC129582776 [Paramacrobiotus metropolitanus]|uniref:uncharacterized protein LOC129582776 n=1 Tax=Paramacrobiotus metropolitanus TaxID=2943436 RepID=UPI002445B108|nr:uncharacterized protein LOC129582776 [Paramacrobiotus metropolitanus]